MSTNEISQTGLGAILVLLALGIFTFGYFIGTESVMNQCRDYGKYVSGSQPARTFVCQEQRP